MKIQWKGKFDTMVRLVPGGEKTLVKKGMTFEVSEKKGEELLKYSRDFQPVTGNVKPEKVEKGSVKTAKPEKVEKEEEEQDEEEMDMEDDDVGEDESEEEEEEEEKAATSKEAKKPMPIDTKAKK